MERFLDYVEIVDLNSELKLNDFCKINDKFYIYGECCWDRDIYKLRDETSVVLRSKGISPFEIWDIYDLYCEKCKELGMKENIELLKSLSFDYAKFFETLKERNVLRALVFVALSDEVYEIIKNSKTKSKAVEQLCNQIPRYITETEAKVIVNTKREDIEENFNKNMKEYKSKNQECLNLLTFNNKMNSILDYLEIIDLNDELQLDDFFVLNGECAVYDYWEYSPKDIENEKENISIILRPKTIDSLFIWQIYELFEEKCKELKQSPTTELFKTIKLDVQQLFKTVTERNLLRRRIVQKSGTANISEIIQKYKLKQHECLSLIQF